MSEGGITPAGLILSGALDIRHRFYRLIYGLEEAKMSADLGTRAVLTTLVEDARASLKEHAKAVRSQIVTARIASKSEDPNRWGGAPLDLIVERAVNGFTSLTSRHHEAYLQLQDSRQVREDLKYLLYRALNLSMVSERHEGLVSLKTSGILQWETTAFSPGGKAATASVLVPWLESLGPLRWPLVVHEVAHYFLPGGGESTEVAMEIAQQNSWSPDAFEEVLADAVAQRHFGAAYPFALAREGYLYSYREHVTGGLSVDQRLRVMGDPADLLGALPDEWGLSHRESMSKSVTPIADDVVQEMRAAALQLLSKVAAEHGWDAVENNPEVVTAAMELMAIDEPAPAVLRPEAAELVTQAFADLQAEPAADVTSVAEAAVHLRMTDGEIFEAAWRREVCRDPEIMSEELAADLTDSRIDEDMAAVAKQDIWLARSLQSAAVHRWLLETIPLAESERQLG